MGRGIDIARRWRRMSVLWRLIAVNITVFAVVRLLGIVALIGGWAIDGVIDNLALPSFIDLFLRHPWTLLTYMFTQYDVLHILFNMLTLYWFGRIFTFTCSPRQMLSLYIIGGLFGAVAYLVAAAAFPTVSGYLLGASASVMAIVVASAVIMPDLELRMWLFGDVRLKWVAIIAAAIFALGLVGNQAGAHVAHIGGMLAGLAYGLLMRRGIDMGRWLNQVIDHIVDMWQRLCRHLRRDSRKRFGHKRPVKPSSRRAPQVDADDRIILDAILDKVKKSGYSSLTTEEKRLLFQVSSKIK